MPTARWQHAQPHHAAHCFKPVQHSTWTSSSHRSSRSSWTATASVLKQQRCPARKACGCVHHRSPLCHASAQMGLAGMVAGFVAPICFDSKCQAASDKAFLIALAVPVVVALLSFAFLLRAPPQQLKDTGQVFEDEATGAVFQVGGKGVAPERDKYGQLAWRPISYTPWPVATDDGGERLRIAVGKVGQEKDRTFVFDKLLPQPSELVVARMPRPLGIVFEYEPRMKRAHVVDLVEGGHADQLRRRASVNKSLRASSVQVGDILRAVTCTNWVYPTQALFGAVAPEQHIVLYGASKQRWGAIQTALTRGMAKDGHVAVVVERRVRPEDRIGA